MFSWNEIHVFFIKDNELLEKYNKIWEKVSDSIRKGSDCEPVCNEKYLKTKLNCYKGIININFYENRMSKEDFLCKWLSVILIDFVFQIGKNY